MNLTKVWYTDQGTRRVNEDCCAVYEREEEFLAVVCDGLGGHGQGDVASQTVVDAVRRFFMGQEYDETYMDRLFRFCNEMLLNAQREMGAVNTMKTTMVAVYGNQEFIQWGHSGDSRFYLFHGARYITRTLDHSVPQMLVNAGEISKRRIRNHPDRSSILHCLGHIWEGREFEVSDVRRTKPGDVMLLCSDGFWENIKEFDMQAALFRYKDLTEALECMIRKTKQNTNGKKMDNNTAVILRVGKEERM